MVICPVALTVGCKKCPVFKVCPLTTVIGDQKAVEPPQESAKKAAPSSKKKG